MGEKQIYAVYLQKTALDTLGDVIKPYLNEGPAGAHLLCVEVDTAGTFCEMTLQARGGHETSIETEIMIPVSMVRIIITLHAEGGGFGFA